MGFLFLPAHKVFVKILPLHKTELEGLRFVVLDFDSKEGNGRHRTLVLKGMG